MSVSSITRRKLALLSRERANDFKLYLSSLTTTDRENLCDFVKKRYILKRNTAIVLALGQTWLFIQMDAQGVSLVFDFMAGIYVASANDTYYNIIALIDDVETKSKKD